MLEWLLKKIGIGDEFVDHLGDTAVAVQHPLLLIVGLALLVPVGAFIYLRQRRNLPSVPFGLRLALTTTRVVVLALLVLVLAGPYIKFDHKSEKKPIVALLFDHSQSMQLPAGPFESDGELDRIAQAAGYQTRSGPIDTEARKALNRISRAKLAQTVVQNGTKDFLGPLAKKYDLQYYSFSREVTPLGVDPAKPEFPEPPNPGGPATHIGDAVGKVLDESGGRQVAGVVVFSDGQNTGGRAPSEVAHAARAAGAPIFAVPVGSSTRLRDVAIVDVFTSGLVSVGDTVKVAVTIESQGFDKRPVKVELRDGDKLLDTKEIVLNSAEQQQVELTFEAKEAGARYLTVQVPPQPEEPDYLRSNNTDVAFVRVSEEKLRVLYVEGLPRWDFRFLKNAMRRDHGLGGRVSKEPEVVLEAEWRRRSPVQQALALPGSVKELSEYHTVILGDVSPKLLTPKFVAMLAEAVREHGVGLIVEAGPLSMPHQYDERLQDLLPVRLRSQAAGVEAPVYKPFRLELTPDGSLHEAMRYYDDPGRNGNAWSRMPPYYWCSATDRAAPGATVLAWNPSVQGRYGKQPLVAYHYAGSGKVLFVGTDSTWLWRQNVGDRFFYKFWGQAVRFVARRDQSGAKKSWIEVRPIRAQPGETAQVDVMAFNADGSPRTEATLPVRVVGGGSATTVQLSADAAARGRYTGRFPLPSPGEYRFTYEAAAEPVEARVRVLVSPEELRHPNVNRPALDLLASTSGGQMVELPDLASIADKLKGETKYAERHREATLWDNWLMLAVLMFVYSLDVGLRRLAGLS
ncbi:MAG TPA: hypothetical protein VKA46_01150 [Gemmataceae bacterium]|nr:hypothetical protein [Gemmataceae bacterium]